MKRSLAFLSLSMLALSACSSSTTSSDVIKIGLILPLTGDLAGLGKDDLNGAQMAAEKINAAGGINGKQVELIAEDGRCSGADGANAAQKLINVDKVFAIVGAGCSGETLAAAPIAEAGKVVMISPLSSSPNVTTAGDYIFRNYPNDALKTTAMAQYFAENNIKKVAVISENTDFCQAFLKSLKEKLGVEAVVFDENVEPGTKDFRSLITRLKDVEFDAFFPNTNGDGTMGPLIQQIRDAGITAPMISHDVADSANMAKTVPGTDGLYIINIPSTVSDSSFTADFTAKYGEANYGVAFAGYAYDAVNLIAEGIKGGATDSTMLKDWLYKLPSYSGIVGTYHFDENGDVVGIPYVLKQVKEGAITTLKDIKVN